MTEDPHTFIRNSGDGSYVLSCVRCGAEYRPQLPCVVSTFLAIIRDFIEIHADCQEEYLDRINAGRGQR